jgi:anti-sigma factor RsiW
MKHMTEEELIAYREGVAEQRTVISEHLAACDDCREELERIEAVLAALDTLPVPDPGADYGRRVWREIAPQLAEKPVRWWQVWLEPRRLSAAGAVAALIIAAFVAGRITKRVNMSDNVASKEQVRERVLVVAVGEHLGHSERMLVELSNAAPNSPAQKEVNISAEQRRAEDLLQENRLYRQTALQEGDAGLASVLDELERVLLDVAHSPDEVTPAQLEAIQKKIEARGILFKVRVVNKELQQRQETREPAPAQNESSKRERNKV